jgi:hypothetical protein
MNQTILFLDGTVRRLPVYTYYGACFTGQATMYTIFQGNFIWIKPGESVPWIESRE